MNRVQFPPWRSAVLPAAVSLILLPQAAWADTAATMVDLTGHWVGYLSLALFVLAYALVVSEEALDLRKSKPVMVAAGLIWALVAWGYAAHGDTHTAEIAVRHNILEYGELFLFLLAAMTYINTMEERRVFDALRVWLVNRGFSLRAIYWVTGLLAFWISPVADNLTTALLMSTVVLAVGREERRFVVVSCVNIVVAANAGGAFSPFGDITTLMVWQKGVIEFREFFDLLLPALVNWFVPALLMSFAVPRTMPKRLHEEVTMRYGALVVVGLFALTISMAVLAHNFLNLPPVLGMTTGLGLLKLFGYHLNRRESALFSAAENGFADTATSFGSSQPRQPARAPFNIFRELERAEWDTLMFFYGIILCVGGLGTIGYLAELSHSMYGGMGASVANIGVGIISAIIDNIPVMYAVLSMHPDMSHGQWLLVTMTAGVGGSLLSIGSAAGVAVMGQARGVYTFFSHLKWTWAVALGYVASIAIHFWLNSGEFLR